MKVDIKTVLMVAVVSAVTVAALSRVPQAKKVLLNT